MKRGKKGQFYLMAAAIIIAALIGLSSGGYIKTEKSADSLYDLGKELKFETAQVIDYGTFSKNSTPEVIADWTGKFQDYSQTQGEKTEDWVFFYGNETDVTAISLREVNTGEVTVALGYANSKVTILSKDTLQKTIKSKKVDLQITNLDVPQNVTITIKNIDYIFTVSPSQSFYFVIKSDTKTVTG